MTGFSHRACGLTFVLGTGVLTLLAIIGGPVPIVRLAALVAIAALAFCWNLGEHARRRSQAGIAAAVRRLCDAAEGDFDAPVPGSVVNADPALAAAMTRLLRQQGSNLDAIEHLALFDAVTALPNRTNFRATVERMLAAMPANGDAGLMFIDLDRFKLVNDSLGHANGDLLLATIANRLREAGETIGEGAPGYRPLIGRLAGDEFTMFLPVAGGAAGLEHAAHIVLERLSRPVEMGGTRFSVGASIGTARWPGDGETLAELMRVADAAMYEAKRAGRGQVAHFSPALAATLAARTRLDADLRGAAAGREFMLVFQPQVAARGGQLVGVEALLRWRHPDGLRLPAQFLPRAQETGLIVEIGEWVVDTVARTIARWDAMGIAYPLAVNISERELGHAEFFHRLRAAMHAAAAPAALLELEITETLAMTCSDAVLEAIAALRADGARIVIDDFGAGFSSIGRLRALPVDRVKLDRGLTRNIADQPEARAIAQAVIALIHGIGCEAVAEGIETKEQADMLAVIGCDILQGYGIAAPMDEDALLAWIDADRPLARTRRG